MDFDVVMLSRIQFALTAMFHYLYPPLSIGLGVLLVIMEGMYLKTGKPIYEAMTKFWVKIFALTFGLGVATGIVMEFEFGTNWATYSRFVGDVFGSALAAEGIFAFFLESGFLAVLVFGWDKVSKKMHFFSTLMVSLGSMFSAVWIVVANSWQQTPAGYHLVGRDAVGNAVEFAEPFTYDPAMIEKFQIRAEITDFWQLVFNPSSVSRLVHVIIGAYILAAFFMMSVSAFYIIRKRHMEFARRCFTIALVFAAITSVAQLLAGHFSAEVVANHQPAKLAAFEGIYKTEEATPLWMFGMPDDEAQEVKYGVAIPGGLSFLVHQDFKTPVPGLDQFPVEDHPPVQIPFQTYHLMIACGMYFIGITLFALFLLWRKKLFEQTWLMWVFVFSVFLPFVANQAGWVAAEVGRQPWIVYGLLRTQDAASKAVDSGEVLASLTLFVLIYIMLFILFLYLLDSKIKHGPDDPTPHEDHADHAEDLLEAAARRGKSQFGMATAEEGGE